MVVLSRVTICGMGQSNAQFDSTNDYLFIIALESFTIKWVSDFIMYYGQMLHLAVVSIVHQFNMGTQIRRVTAYWMGQSNAEFNFTNGYLSMIVLQSLTI